ncbi:MAG: hypothetical protein NC307_15575 [Roseburia sp.]|nr:hypothetical protein [Roseburia sp.]
MRYEEIMMQYERCREAQQENESMEAAVFTVQILEMVGAERLEKAIKAPPGSNAAEEYNEVCQKLAEWTGQSMEAADMQIKRAKERIDAVSIDQRPRDKNGQLHDLCRTCRRELEGGCREICYMSKIVKEMLSRKGA